MCDDSPNHMQIPFCRLHGALGAPSSPHCQRRSSFYHLLHTSPPFCQVLQATSVPLDTLWFFCYQTLNGPNKRGLRRQNTASHCAQLWVCFVSSPPPPFCFHSLSNTEINIRYLPGVVRGSQEVGKPGPCPPGIRRCVTQILMTLHYLGPQFGLVTLQACGESVIVHFMIMNGIAWRRSHSDFHLPPHSINLTPHYTPFFPLCFPHSIRTKKGKGIKRTDKFWWKWWSVRREVTGDILADEGGKHCLRSTRYKEVCLYLKRNSRGGMGVWWGVRGTGKRGDRETLIGIVKTKQT